MLKDHLDLARRDWDLGYFSFLFFIVVIISLSTTCLRISIRGRRIKRNITRVGVGPLIFAIYVNISAVSHTHKKREIVLPPWMVRSLRLMIASRGIMCQIKYWFF